MYILFNTWTSMVLVGVSLTRMVGAVPAPAVADYSIALQAHEILPLPGQHFTPKANVDNVIAQSRAKYPGNLAVSPTKTGKDIGNFGISSRSLNQRNENVAISEAKYILRKFGLDPDVIENLVNKIVMEMGIDAFNEQFELVIDSIMPELIPGFIVIGGQLLDVSYHPDSPHDPERVIAFSHAMVEGEGDEKRVMTSEAERLQSPLYNVIISDIEVSLQEVVTNGHVLANVKPEKADELRDAVFQFAVAMKSINVNHATAPSSQVGTAIAEREQNTNLDLIPVDAISGMMKEFAKLATSAARVIAKMVEDIEKIAEDAKQRKKERLQNKLHKSKEIPSTTSHTPISLTSGVAKRFIDLIVGAVAHWATEEIAVSILKKVIKAASKIPARYTTDPKKLYSPSSDREEEKETGKKHIHERPSDIEIEAIRKTAGKGNKSN